jgi:hypothetical protein
MSLFWGDLHNHCAVSYGTGTAERALRNAREHLDFCTITGHAFWPDMPTDLDENDATMLKHFGGFEKLRLFWPSLLRSLEEANEPGSFVTFPSFEWHSMRYGDHNCYSASAELPLLDADSPAGLERALRSAGLEPLVLPHHIGYATGFRGIDWHHFDEQRSPLVEIFSNHGCSEADDAPYPYHHNMGPRFGGSTARAGLMAGHRFGFYAGTDSHDGYPGHYGHGRVGVLAERLDREHLWESLRARRTIASTGARFEVEVALDGAGIGEAVVRRDAMTLELKVEGTAELDAVDVIEGGAWGWRVRRLSPAPRNASLEPGRYKVRVETGWGRHGTSSSWEVEAQVTDGRLLDATPCFRYSGHGNAEQEPTERVLGHDECEVRWTARALARPDGGVGGSHHQSGGPQAMLLEIEATERSGLRVRANDLLIDAPLEHLARESVGRHLGGLSSSAVVVQRAVPEREFSLVRELRFEPEPGPGFIYVRVLQADGQAAWASPIWFE